MLTMGKLRKATRNVPDDAIVLARDRDWVNLAMTHVIGCGPAPDEVKVMPDGISDISVDQSGILFVRTSEQMYGGDDLEEIFNARQFVVFCDND